MSSPLPRVVLTESAPAPLPQFSQAVVYGDLVFCSGNIGIIPGTNFEQAQPTVKERTKQALNNLSAVLISAGSSLQNTIKMNIYLTKMADFGAVNEAYDEFFTSIYKPARTCVAVFELPFGTDVEIECTAYVNRP